MEEEEEDLDDDLSLHEHRSASCHLAAKNEPRDWSVARVAKSKKELVRLPLLTSHACPPSASAVASFFLWVTTTPDAALVKG